MTNPELVVALHKALSNTIDTLLEVYANGENWLLWCEHDETCTLDSAVALRNQLVFSDYNGQLYQRGTK